ncbi:MAG: Holliday junction resolvase RuvX [Candidatus Sungbacteria bacterium]|nr:Holliday junction resolvase RuvX [Candidatus Sungbacteria bacterium]
MRYLGIDYGTKRIGVAVSDAGGRIAFPLRTIANKPSGLALQKLARMVYREKIKRVIIGLPLALGGHETQQTATVRSFAQLLGNIVRAPLIFENEMLTTRIAKQAGANRTNVDRISAAIILQSYLDKIQRSKSPPSVAVLLRRTGK